ncbi:MAG: DNA packaging protein [Paracoccus sp. (in: a-proteobacteria)]|uniref:DNA packaging protein n=1 Tax=Paracoccus sp. TaxID=267 RepID=UPI0026DEA1D6|nr:DNA packaging protein [Paracoccus sp. (in: a-proteobacteria)]MDO5633086.1 DNA packaging protein [Paracoccus sp. (in: a-proteobacteria)]
MTIAEGIPSIMTEAELADLLGIAASQVRTKTRECRLVKAGNARWDVRQSLVRYLDHLRGIAARTGPGVGAPSDDYKAERLRLAKQQADKIEIQNEQARGELVRSADVEREWANVLRDVRSTMLAVSSRVGAKLPHLTAHDISEIDREIKAALEGLANGN